MWPSEEASPSAARKCIVAGSVAQEVSSSAKVCTHGSGGVEQASSSGGCAGVPAVVMTNSEEAKGSLSNCTALQQNRPAPSDDRVSSTSNKTLSANNTSSKLDASLVVDDSLSEYNIQKSEQSKH